MVYNSIAFQESQCSTIMHQKVDDSKMAEKKLHVYLTNVVRVNLDPAAPYLHRDFV